MCYIFVNAIIILLQIVITGSQKSAYNEKCNNTEQCADHRYQCQFDEENVLRCLCDRFHSWEDDMGCVQIYNASEMMGMTVSVTDNILQLEEQVKVIMQTQIAAGLFVFGMVAFATLAVAVFCIYVHVKDRKLYNSVLRTKRNSRIIVHQPRTLTSTSIV